MKQAEEQVSIFDLDTWSGKTYPVPSPPKKEKTSSRCLKKSAASLTPTFQFLDLRAGSGLVRGASWQMDTALPGEFTTLNFSECPNVAVESHLSQILEENPHPKYYLSALACKGILNRATRRGKDLPKPLYNALILQSRSKKEQDVRGEVKVSSPNTTERERCQRSTTNSCAIDVFTLNGKEVAQTIDAHYYLGVGSRGGQEREMVFDARGQDLVFDAQGNGDGKISPTIIGDHENRVNYFTALTFSCYAYDKWQENDKGASLIASGGMYQGGSENICLAVDCRNGSEGEINGTLQAKESGGISHNSNNVLRQNQFIRRFTPLEWERLQGFPTIREVRFTEMTKDEYIAWNISEGNIIVDTSEGKVYGTRGPGGIKLDQPKELLGSNVNGYLVVSIRNGHTKMQCRIHRIVWIAQHGIIPNGYVIDHKNNNKKDNRIENLQMLTPAENSTKARTDGLYKIHGDAGTAKITDEVHDAIQYLYGNSDISIRELSEKFGISKSRVHQIIHESGWTDIGEWVDSTGKKRKTSDANRYKALGNSIALPFWRWLTKQISLQYAYTPTMASLFDGIGGFPLLWEEVNGKGTAIWASEIEEFPIAVTKYHFGED